MKLTRLLSIAALLPALWTSTAFADSFAATVDTPVATGPFARVNPPDDPTGGAYTTPTLLFVPAAAVPTWNVRVITSLDMQGPSAPDKLAVGSCGNTSCVGFQPGIGGELGLPGGFTFGAGTRWVGGDTADFNGGISPYFQLRLHILGNENGRGFQLGSSVTYKFVGFGSNQGVPEQDPGEMEWSVSSQYRQRRYEVGLQGVIGKDFSTVASDGEVHAYALYRPVSQLGIGAASQLRVALVQPPGGPQPFGDVIAGGIASVTIGRWQLAGLGGESTVGLASGSTVKVGALGEVFGTARF
jgi:hypothetical protein